jgi:hypothetical protein
VPQQQQQIANKARVSLQFAAAAAGAEVIKRLLLLPGMPRYKVFPSYTLLKKQF